MKCHKTVKNILIGMVLSILLCTGAWAIPYEYDGHYYDVIAAPNITWADARAQALDNYYLGLEGHLVTITSAEEDTAVYAMIQENGLGEMWAGGYQTAAGDTDAQAGWTWVNEEGSFPGYTSSSPYANWGNGEPNDAYGVGSEQFLGLNWANGWNDEGNLDNIAGYVIEYDPNTINDVNPVPEPCTIFLLGSGLLGIAGFRKKVK